jgi:hypothetical protein
LLAASEQTKEVTNLLITNVLRRCFIKLVTEGCTTDGLIDPFKEKAKQNCV